MLIGKPSGLLKRVVWALETFSSAPLVALMVLTVIDVALRELLGTPILGVIELQAYFLVLLTYSAMGALGWKGEHVAIDFVYDAFGPRLKALLDSFTNLIGALLFGAFAVQTWRSGNALAENLEKSLTLDWPIAPWHYAAAVAMGIGSVLHFARLFMRNPTIVTAKTS